MAILFTPGQLNRRAEFYQQLARYLSAGIGITAALDQLAQRPPARSFREPIRRTLQHINEGSPFTESLQRSGQWLPEFDLALLHAGEQSGRLDVCLRLLGDYYLDRARMASQLISGLMYPVFLFHFAVFILPFPQLFVTGNWMAYLARTLPVLVPVYGLVALIIYASQSRHGERWRAIMETLLRPVPILGTARHQLALARLSAALGALLSAGVTIIEAWEMGADASGSLAMRRTVYAWRPELMGGRTPAEMVSKSPRQFPDLFASQYHSGEISGSLDEVLRTLHRYYQAEGSQNLNLLAVWVPRVVYLAVALMIAYRVVSFWTGYFAQAMSAGGL